MRLRVLVVPDKFKGTLRARTAAEAIRRGWLRARPGDKLVLLPMSDGGDGFGEVLSELLKAEVQTVSTLDAAYRPCTAQWWWEPTTETAIIESAKVVGLAMLPSKVFHPFQLDTFGLGAVLLAAAEKGVKECLVGIGGSATNDGGFGLARALGWEFLDSDGNHLEQWTGLEKLKEIRSPKRKRLFRKITVAVDVQNPLLGLKGATRVYGPQKGLRVEDFCKAERSLRQLAKVVRRTFDHDFARESGTGAAGGLGFGLRAFLRAELGSGFDLFAVKAALDERLKQVDLVITGEGSIDRSTLMGKGVGQVASRCCELGLPCLGLAGSAIQGCENLFTRTHGLTEMTTLEKAKARPAYWLERLAEQAARGWTETRQAKA